MLIKNFAENIFIEQTKNWYKKA